MEKTKRTRKTTSIVAKAMVDYKNPEFTTEDIAVKYGVCPATLTVWARKSGIPLRTRGRHALNEPTARHRRILDLSGHLCYEKIGQQMGMKKQAVHRIIKRWRSWQQGNRPRFAPGDVLVWQGKKLTVIDANAVDGTLEDESGRIYKHFTWTGGAVPRKIGVNPKYCLPTVRTAA